MIIERETDPARFQNVCQHYCRHGMEMINGVPRWTQCSANTIAEVCQQETASNFHSEDGVTDADMVLHAHTTGLPVQTHDRA